MPPFGCLQLPIRVNDMDQPFKKPYFLSASMAYSEHVGSNKQDSRSLLGAISL